MQLRIKKCSRNRELEIAETELLKVKHSSVLLLVFTENNELNVFLIKRPQHMKHHAGQIALPGGRIEKGETALETAIRETWEEIGLLRNKMKFWYIVAIICSGESFSDSPFVAWLSTKPELKINPYEVEKTISFPLKTMKKLLKKLKSKHYRNIKSSLFLI